MRRSDGTRVAVMHPERWINDRQSVARARGGRRGVRELVGASNCVIRPYH